MARPIVLIPHLFWLADTIKFRKDYSPSSSPPSLPYKWYQIPVLSFGCFNRPESKRMVTTRGYDVACDSHIFDSTHSAVWKHHKF